MAVDRHLFISLLFVCDVIFAIVLFNLCCWFFFLVVVTKMDYAALFKGGKFNPEKLATVFLPDAECNKRAKVKNDDYKSALTTLGRSRDQWKGEYKIGDRRFLLAHVYDRDGDLEDITKNGGAKSLKPGFGITLCKCDCCKS